MEPGVRGNRPLTENSSGVRSSSGQLVSWGPQGAAQGLLEGLSVFSSTVSAPERFGGKRCGYGENANVSWIFMIKEKTVLHCAGVIMMRKMGSFQSF